MKLRLFRYITLGNAALYLFGAAVAYTLKYHYSTATADDLSWILYPTALLVELMTGRHFIREIFSGFVDYSHGITIAPACGGVNFLIISFCTALFPLAYRIRQTKKKWLWFGTALASSYFLTIVVNGLRIVLSIYLIEHEVHYGWLTPERIHRIEGVVVYCIFLSVFYIFMRRAVRSLCIEKATGEGCEMVTGGCKDLTIFTPLVCYLFLALGVPVLRGCHHEPGLRFSEHFWTVVLASASVFMFVHLMRLYSKRIRFNIGSIVRRRFRPGKESGRNSET